MMGDVVRVLSQPSTWSKIGVQALQHVEIVLLALVAAVMVAVPGGIFLAGLKKIAEPIMSAVGLLMTIPSVSLLAIMVPFLGIGVVPALVALGLYALLPILRNTYAGILAVSPAAVDAGKGMGMTPGQLLWLVELPLAFPVIMNGIRTSTVYVIGWAALAAYIGAGGLGDSIIRGLSLMSGGWLLAGALPVTAMALLADALLGRVERRLTEAVS
ncbi:MAG: ABC transporter permease [Bacillota bacterium]|nr:ABC transporter permease [Bacillota bacterium]